VRFVRPRAPHPSLGAGWSHDALEPGAPVSATPPRGTRGGLPSRSRRGRRARRSRERLSRAAGGAGAAQSEAGVVRRAARCRLRD
jgi:hypothetical protein